MFFSVVIPAFNRLEMLRQALASVIGQKFQEFETIVVDDGSNEDIESAVRECNLPVRYLRQQNSGPGAARNLGLRHARGQYVAFLDSDDTWFPWTLAVFRRAIEENNGPSFLAGFGSSPGENWDMSANGC